jgi:prepilin-type N-terminal cleavage/methylation domain-containing protein
MQGRERVAGYTLVEIIVALLVFTIGALALAASSGIVAGAMANNAARELAARTAVSRVETIASQCAIATSGRETVRQIESEWVTTPGPTTTEVTESVRCPALGRPCTASYRATIWCPP